MLWKLIEENYIGYYYLIGQKILLILYGVVSLTYQSPIFLYNPDFFQLGAPSLLSKQRVCLLNAFETMFSESISSVFKHFSGEYDIYAEKLSM